MNTREYETSFSFDALVDLFRQTHEAMQQSAARAVDKSLAGRNWLFGWYIVEYEQKGADRAEIYGKRLIEGLAIRMRKCGVRGTSPTNLRKFREFYRRYPEIRQTLPVESITRMLSDSSEIQQTASVESLSVLTASPALTATIAKHFNLGWSHYVELLTIDSQDERRFYEIESLQNGWTVQELKRQIASSLYERLALSRDKDEIMRLAREGQVVECHRKNDSLVELTLPKDANIFASKYQLYLPSKEELKHQVELATSTLEDGTP